MPCIDCYCLLCIYCFFPPLFSGRPRCYRRLQRCRVRLRRRRQYHYRRASRQAEPLHLSLISPICVYLSDALGICCCYVTFLFKCIACLFRPLLYIHVPYAACYIYKYYTTVSPAPCLSTRIR